MDILTLYHFLLYFFFSYFVKNNYFLVICTSILWEIFEYTITNTPVIRDFMIKNWPLKPIQTTKKTETGLIIPWKTESLHMRMEDILANLLGYYVGLLFWQYF